MAYEHNLSEINQEMLDVVNGFAKEFETVLREDNIGDFREKYQQAFVHNQKKLKEKLEKQDGKLGGQDENQRLSEANLKGLQGAIQRLYKALPKNKYDDSDMSDYHYVTLDDGKVYRLSDFNSEFIDPLLDPVEKGLEHLKQEIERLSPPPQERKGGLKGLIERIYKTKENGDQSNINERGDR